MDFFFLPLCKSLIPSENAVGSRNKTNVVYKITFLLLLLVITRKQNWNGYRSRLTYSDKFYIWKRNVKKNLSTILCIVSLLNSTILIQISTMCIIQKHPFSSFLFCQRCEHGKHRNTYLFWKVKEKISKQLQTWCMSLCKRALFFLRDSNKQVRVSLKQFKWENVWHYETLAILNTKLWICTSLFPRGKMYYNTNCSLNYKRIIHWK